MKQSLRIAQLCADRGIAPGGTKGAARHLAGVAGGLVEAGHSVTTYSEREQLGPHPVHCVRLAELETATAIDLVYERYSLSSGGGLRYARRLGVPFVLEVNAPLVSEARQHRPETVDPGAGEREERLLRDADVVIVVSRTLAAWARTLRDGPVVVIPNGFEPAWFPDGVRHSDRDDRLVFLGHPRPWHGADRIPNLIRLLNERGHRPQVTVIGGGDGGDELEQVAARQGVQSQLTITGAVEPDIASLLVTRAAVGLAPYKAQPGFYFSPLKILDYLAAGLAIVSTDQGDIGELVGDAGLVVSDPDNDEQFADAVGSLLDDRRGREQMGRAGRRRAFESMTWAHVAERTEAAIGLALSGRMALGPT